MILNLEELRKKFFDTIKKYDRIFADWCEIVLSWISFPFLMLLAFFPHIMCAAVLYEIICDLIL